VTPLIRVVALAVLPVSLLISFAHLLGAERGPGDGFTAGIITSLGLTLEYLAFGYREARSRFAWVHFEVVLFGGLLLSLAASLLPLLAGAPLLAPQQADLEVPGLGSVKLSRGLMFDFGIYLTVVGGSMTAIDSLERAIE
jgi:multisubunit Na+/H+ antiporter MnhB subunit